MPKGPVHPLPATGPCRSASVLEWVLPPVWLGSDRAKLLGPWLKLLHGTRVRAQVSNSHYSSDLLSLNHWCCLLSCWPTRGNAKDNQPRWHINLREKYGFESFDRTFISIWSRQQDVIFISPERVAVYQVSRSRATAKLATRDASGGGGNYVLAVSVLDAHDGREIKQLRFPTNPEYSKVMATHDGKFIVRTGDVLYLYSADFERLASKNLP